jgi:ferredoxin
VDENQPQWCGKTVEETDLHTFHILRAFHCAGRCTDCGACESACPVGIKMRRLTSKLEKDIRELYNYSPGLDMESTPPLSVYRPDDPEPFSTG